MVLRVEYRNIALFEVSHPTILPVLAPFCGSSSVEVEIALEIDDF